MNGRHCFGEEPTVYEGEGKNPATALIAAATTLLEHDPDGYVLAVSVSQSEGMYYAVIVA